MDHKVLSDFKLQTEELKIFFRSSTALSVYVFDFQILIIRISLFPLH